MKRLFLVPVLLLSFTSIATAQKKSDDCKAQRGPDGKRVCELKIEGDDISADRVNPDGDRLIARKPLEHTSLIRYRVTFVDKMAKDAERF